MRQLTDTPCTHSHTYARTYTYVQKGFFWLSSFKCEQSCTLAVSLYECSKPSLPVCSVVHWWEISSFQWLLCSHSCVHTLIRYRIQTFVGDMNGEPSVCVLVCIYVCDGVPVCCVFVWVWMCLCCRDLFFSLSLHFTSLLLSLRFIFCFHFTSHSKKLCVFVRSHTLLPVCSLDSVFSLGCTIKLNFCVARCECVCANFFSSCLVQAQRQSRFA